MSAWLPNSPQREMREQVASTIYHGHVSSDCDHLSKLLHDEYAIQALGERMTNEWKYWRHDDNSYDNTLYGIDECRLVLGPVRSFGWAVEMGIVTGHWPAWAGKQFGAVVTLAMLLVALTIIPIKRRIQARS